MFKFIRSGKGKVKVGDEVHTDEEFYEQYPDAPKIKGDVVCMEYFRDYDGEVCYREHIQTPKGIKQKGTRGVPWPEADEFIKKRDEVNGHVIKERERKIRARAKDIPDEGPIIRGKQIRHNLEKTDGLSNDK